jgi:hypothetical protein
MNTDVLSCRNYSHFPYSPGIVRKKKFLLLLNDKNFFLRTIPGE